MFEAQLEAAVDSSLNPIPGASTSLYHFSCCSNLLLDCPWHIEANFQTSFCLQLKQFVKKCKVANFTKQMKQIVEKIQDTSKVIIQRRRSASLNLANSASVVSPVYVHILNQHMHMLKHGGRGCTVEEILTPSPLLFQICRNRGGGGSDRWAG